MSEQAAESAAIVKTVADIVRREQPQSAKVTNLGSFTPANLTEAIALAKMISRSDLVPKEYKGKPENVLIGMQYAAELGVPPLLGIQNIAIINGRASVWGDLFLAIIQASPAYEYHEERFEGEGDTFGAVCVMKRRGQQAHAVKFTVGDAKRAQLWNKQGPWQTNPKRMMQMRARGFAGRDKFSDALKGLIIAEEAMDLPIDTSEAKKQREAATLDMVTTAGAISDMMPSAEPNRGHDDTGLDRSQGQAPARPDSVMCSECRVINGHDPSCKFYGKQEQDAKTSKPTLKGAYLVLKVSKKLKKDKKTPFLLLDVVNPENAQGTLYVWHQSFFDYLEGKSDVPLVAEVAKSTLSGKDYFSVEHILELAGTKFVNDKPAATGEAPVEREPGEDEEF